MFSIEKHEENFERFEWNKPLAGIKMLFGPTEKRLSEIDFAMPTITWLDYDGPLNSAVIGDVDGGACGQSRLCDGRLSECAPTAPK